jgi:hypothetical protein
MTGRVHAEVDGLAVVSAGERDAAARQAIWLAAVGGLPGRLHVDGRDYVREVEGIADGDLVRVAGIHGHLLVAHAARAPAWAQGDLDDRPDDRHRDSDARSRVSREWAGLIEQLEPRWLRRHKVRTKAGECKTPTLNETEAGML